MTEPTRGGRLRGALLLLPVLLLDRLSKCAAAALCRGPAELLPGLVRLQPVRNTGAAFSMLARQPWLTTLLTAAVLAVLLVWLLRTKTASGLTRCALWMVLGGGLSNLYDRIAYGAVIDFICPEFVDFAIFNLADCFICIGAGLAVIGVLTEEKRRSGA